jgi:hypothetical protein
MIILFMLTGLNDPSRIVGYRNEAFGLMPMEPKSKTLTNWMLGSGISPFLLNPDQQRVDINSFEDYDPQLSVMPRISFSFPDFG